MKLLLLIIFIFHCYLKQSEVSGAQSYGGRFSGFHNEITLGLLTDTKNDDIRKVFRKAVDVANRDLSIPIRDYTDSVQYGNIYETSKKLCKMLRTGISGIFGPTARNTAKHVMNICDTKEIPFIDLRMEENPFSPRINMYPNPLQLARAIQAVIKAYNWPSFTILYESSEYLTIVNEITNLFDQDGPIITIRKYDLQLYGNYRSVLRRIRTSKDNSVVIIGSIETLPELLIQAQQIGIITDQYKYIIGNLDFHSINLEQIQFSEANITGFRIVSPENEEVKELIKTLGYDEGIEFRNVSCPITLDMALLYDGVKLFAKTSEDFQFQQEMIDCNSESHWKNGYTLLNLIGLKTMDGVTGKIIFENGIRNEFQLELIEMTTSGLVKIGTWSTDLDPSSELEFERYVPEAVQLETNDELSLVNKSFIVLTALSNPYGMLKSSTTKLVGNDRYEGFGVELIQRLAEKLGFNYTFQIHKDNQYGAYNVETNTSTGMIREIMEGRVDLAITDLTITSQREAGVDFTIPFMNLGIAILYKKPQKEPPKLFSFMDPFSKEVWMYLGLAYLGVSLSLFILARLSPMEWDNPYPCIEKPIELENQFSFSNSLWFSTGALLQEGSEIAPKAPSTRTVASIWWFFTLIMVSSYTANLAAFLTVESLSSPINDVNDLAENKGNVKYGTVANGATRTFFQVSDEPTYMKINEYLTNNPHLLLKNNVEAVEKVLNENYAFFMESTSIEYNIYRKCNLTQIGSLLDEKGYGIAMKKNSPYRDKLNHALLELQESGVISKMKNKWWKEVGTSGCSAKKEQSEAAELDMDNLGGVYFVLSIGSIIALFYGLVDWTVAVFRQSRKAHVPFKQEFKEEFKFVSQLNNFTKTVKPTTASSYSRNSSVTMQSTENDSTNNKTSANSNGKALPTRISNF
ncbi:glutamate receptor ionotropic, kainate 2-like [Condylostylus longicornis]|uniref:glutamate receptor ionotropic, kainate 2-like n=1 Tax=Condylostylus longicornis TaxID=2530218 RepID=UPI00244E359A|nr:glutamate receptor ionotropic, kainate 2-like [Condylostylus longicornis]